MSKKTVKTLTPYDLELIGQLIDKEVWIQKELNVEPDKVYTKYLYGLKLRAKNTLKVMKTRIGEI